ncbi:aspartate--tRNA ligase, mitochondrial-like [Watersipora subatra]|uniref:aspartate--tRNA ligase, mitochondrial-like n=1 Tax=Watersipora subatra TaxID=2589382 RepID=UPI00355BF051
MLRQVYKEITNFPLINKLSQILPAHSRNASISSTELPIDLERETSADSQLRSHKCGEITARDVGQSVKLYGWLDYNRGKFFTIRDATGSCQVLCPASTNLPPKESVVSVEGIVQHRPRKDINSKMMTGAVEVLGMKVTTLNECTHMPYPFHDAPKEDIRMRYRYIDLRSQKMQYNLRMRSSFILNLRKYLCEKHGFVDVETPTLFRRTPGGAKEFIVPTQKAGLFYSLPQSPQQFKQLLMAGGIDRYMQVAKCYRDEGAKPERQPEFTQLDLELSFTNQEQIKALVEEMIFNCWPKELDRLAAPFPRLSYADAISMYGSDKPDTRFGSIITDLTDVFPPLDVFGPPIPDKQLHIKAIAIKNGCTLMKNKAIKRIQSLVQAQHLVDVAVVKVDAGVWNSPLTRYLRGTDIQEQVNTKLEVSNNDMILLCANHSWKTVCQALGTARTLVAQHCLENGTPLYETDKLFHFLWIEDFPLFEEDAKLQSSHHPFTAPLEEDIPLLSSAPTQVRGQHYDLVLNGCEIGGGSIRIHNSKLQRFILEKILQEDTNQLEHLLEALDSGCPPHGGIALGLDRLLSIMCDAPTIRDVIAFPKSSKGMDLMTGAPCEVNDNELCDYHISVSDENTTCNR